MHRIDGGSSRLPEAFTKKKDLGDWKKTIHNIL